MVYLVKPMRPGCRRLEPWQIGIGRLLMKNGFDAIRGPQAKMGEHSNAPFSTRYPALQMILMIQSEAGRKASKIQKNPEAKKNHEINVMTKS